jgi:hypothetical protein
MLGSLKREFEEINYSLFVYGGQGKKNTHFLNFTANHSMISIFLDQVSPSRQHTEPICFDETALMLMTGLNWTDAAHRVVILIGVSNTDSATSSQQASLLVDEIAMSYATVYTLHAFPGTRTQGLYERLASATDGKYLPLDQLTQSIHGIELVLRKTIDDCQGTHTLS